MHKLGYDRGGRGKIAIVPAIFCYSLLCLCMQGNCVIFCSARCLPNSNRDLPNPIGVCRIRKMFIVSRQCFYRIRRIPTESEKNKPNSNDSKSDFAYLFHINITELELCLPGPNNSYRIQTVLVQSAPHTGPTILYLRKNSRPSGTGAVRICKNVA